MAALVGARASRRPWAFRPATDGLMGTRSGNLDPGSCSHSWRTGVGGQGTDPAALRNRGCSRRFRAVPGHAHPCSPATGRKLQKPSISSAIASSANWSLAAAGGPSTPWCSPAVSANTPPRCKRWSAPARPGLHRPRPGRQRRPRYPYRQAGSAVDVLVIPTNEEWMIAHHPRRCSASKPKRLVSPRSNDRGLFLGFSKP